MKSAVWTKAIAKCADPRRAKHFLDLFAAASPGMALDQLAQPTVQVLAILFGGSQALSSWLVAHPDWLERLEPERLRFPRRKQGLWKEVNGWLEPLLAARDFTAALANLRVFKQREMLRIGTRDLAGLGPVPELIQEISDVADICLETVWQVCWLQLAERFGRPYHRDAAGKWHATAGCVLGLGKLGGQELNYSSDVDVIFAYSDEGEVLKEEPSPQAPADSTKKAVSKRGRAVAGPAARPVLRNHQFFNRLAEAFIAEVTRMGPEGTLYRIDLRLRPEGDTGPLSRALTSFENYYAQWGQTWERMMLIKARVVAGDETLGAEFLELIQPFRYPRSTNEGALAEIGAMKDRIENEVVKAGELERDVKRGRGGIREIEFIVQSLQLIHGGRQPFLQGPQTLPCLSKLVQYELLTAEASRDLEAAYCFLRQVEHRLQMEDNRQTHTIPTERPARERLARLMGCATLRKFEAVHQQHRGNVRREFERLFKAAPARTNGASPFPREFVEAAEEWKQLLDQHGFKDKEKAVRVLREFVEGPGYVHVSPRTSALAYQLLPRLFGMCPAGDGRARTPDRRVLSDPDRVVTRLDSFIAAYGARATLFELWTSNPSIFDLLLVLFDRSEFLAELAIRTPDLVDELVTSGRLRQRKTAAETLRDLRHGLADADQHLWLRRYHQAELMRIGLRDILGLADFEQYLTELSALADACLQYAVEVVTRKHKLKTSPFVVIGLGKLGGEEIDYGSDLDIVFVAEARARNLAALSRLAVEVMELVSSRTEQGMVFHTDARLRPDGEKGLLVNTLRSYEEYYRQRAQLWEIQSLTRTRPVAGDLKLGAQFQELAAALTNFQVPARPLAAYAPEWKQKILQMRMRIEKERTPVGKGELAIKTGAGGLMDAEFIAQALCLEHGWREPNTLDALQRGREAGVVPEADKLIENYRKLRRLEGILRRWSYEGETVLPDDPAPYYRVSVRCGFATPEAFRAAVGEWRGAIRAVFERVFGAVTGPGNRARS